MSALGQKQTLAALSTAVFGQVQDISVDHLDADHAKKRMEQLILDRTRELLRENDLALS